MLDSRTTIGRVLKHETMRYTLTIDMYIDAESNNQAKLVAAEIVKQQRKKFDNQASVVTIHKTPFGSLEAKLIHKGTL